MRAYMRVEVLSNGNHFSAGVNIDDMVLGVNAIPTLVKDHLSRCSVQQLLLLDVPGQK